MLTSSFVIKLVFSDIYHVKVTANGDVKTSNLFDQKNSNLAKISITDLKECFPYCKIKPPGEIFCEKCEKNNYPAYNH